MPVYSYTVLDAEGKSVSGLTQGASLDAVAQRLAAMGMTVQSLNLEENKNDPVVEASRNAEALPPTGERSPVMTQIVGPLIASSTLPAVQFFFRQMGTMLHAGVPMVQALETLARQSTSPILGRIVMEARDHVSAGNPLSVGLQRYPEVFTPLMLSMVRAGESGGFLSDQCNQLSDYIQRDIELRNLIKRETAYPKFVVGASVFIILVANGILNFVAPGKPGIVAPVALWALIAICSVAGFLFVRVGLKNPQIRFAYDRFVLGVPGIGGMVKGFAMAKFGRAFGALYKGGVPLPQAIQLSADACGNEFLRSRMYPASQMLQEGFGVTETFAQTLAFSPLVLDMTRTGEMTGNMDQMLIKLAEFYEDEGQTRAKQAALLLGVACLLAVGVYVGYVVVSFWSGYGSNYSNELNSGGQ